MREKLNASVLSLKENRLPEDKGKTGGDLRGDKQPKKNRRMEMSSKKKLEVTLSTNIKRRKKEK